MKLMMRNILLGTALLWTLGASAQIDMRQVFKAMPVTMIPYLSDNNRLDMIDFVDSNMKAEVRHQLDGKSELLRLTNVYAKLMLNEASTVEMRLLDVGEQVDSARQIVCLVHTFGSDIRESTVDFYSVQWRKLAASAYIQLPDELFTAQLNEVEATLTIQPGNEFERPANEDQKVTEKPLMVLKWVNEKFN